MASFRIEFAASVRKDFRKIPSNDAGRILKAIDGLAADPRPPQSKKLTGAELYRIRVGVYRVLYELHEGRLVVVVVKVAHRKEVYR